MGERAVYALGLDLGTTFTAAGVWREGRAEIASLGTRSAVIPSVVLLRSDESVLVGEAAVRRAVVEPDRVAREFKRRLGDSTPLLLGGVPFSAQALMARVLASVVGQVAAAQGGLPERVCLCHPANWGMFKTDLLGQVVRLADLEVPVSLITEPEAAAVFYGQEQRLAVGESVAVYDLGGGTFDAAVLTRTEEGFAVVGQPEGIERLGGVDVDAAVFRHVMRSVPEAFAGLDEEDPAAVAAVARVRTECTEAKEALSSDTDVTIPVMLPGVTTEVRLTRAELEAMVRPSLYDSIEALKRAVRSAGLTPADLAAVLLVGGASRMPLVAQLVGSELGRPVVVDAHPKHSVALGAAWLASGHTLAAPAVAPSTVAVTTQARPEARPAAPVPDTSPTPPIRSFPVKPVPIWLPANEQRPSAPATRALPMIDLREENAKAEAVRSRPVQPPAVQPPVVQPPVVQPAAVQPPVVRQVPQSAAAHGGWSPSMPVDALRGHRPSSRDGSSPMLASEQVGHDWRPGLIWMALGTAGLLVLGAGWVVWQGGPARELVFPAAASGSSATTVGSGNDGEGSVLVPGTGPDGAPLPTAAGTAPRGRLVVTVRLAGTGGHVTSTDGAIACPGKCSANYPSDQKIVLVASATGFQGWQGCSQPNWTTCTLTGNAAYSPTAKYRTGSATTSAPPPPISPPPTSPSTPPTTSTTPPPEPETTPSTTAAPPPSSGPSVSE